jgi:ABC-type molybdenum transport system ATPase subunit/photorepair protein PhrA
LPAPSSAGLTHALTHSRTHAFTQSCQSPHRFNTLSQGEQKLVVIAAAVAHGPELLVVDEVGQGLDLHHRARLGALVQALAASSPSGAGVTLVVITHHDDEVPACVTHAMLLGRGEVAFCGEAQTDEAVALLKRRM